MKLDIIYNEDCIGKKGMRILPDKSIDMVLADMPYGTTACEWDTIIPLEPLWEQLKRVIKSNGAIVLTASQPFTSILVMSNLKMFKYCWVWDKGIASNSQLVKYQPLKIHEDICIFSKEITNYYPQGISDCYIIRSNKNRSKGVEHIGSEVKREIFLQTKTGYPKSIQKFKPCNLKKLHPTQKPVALFEYLIKTYTNEGDIVLDNCIGSGTTAVACKRLNRRYIGYETSKKYCQIAEARLEAQKSLWDIKGGK